MTPTPEPGSVVLLGSGILGVLRVIDALLLARHQQPSLILLDRMLPTIGGEESRLLQRSDAQIAHVPGF